MAVLIRDATSLDVSAMLDLLYDLGRPSPLSNLDVQKFEEILSKYVADKDKMLIVADYDGAVVGLASAMFLTRCNHSQLEMYIPELVVHSGFRKRGIGKMLIRQCILLASKKQCYRIRLESGNQRKDSHAFYERVGFLQSALSYELLIPDYSAV